jgi:hypothetical protein
MSRKTNSEPPLKKLFSRLGFWNSILFSGVFEIQFFTMVDRLPNEIFQLIFRMLDLEPDGRSAALVRTTNGVCLSE